MLRHQVPPIDEGEGSPSVGGKKMKTKPILDKRPNADGEPTMDEEMLHGLENPIAKGQLPQLSQWRLSKRSLVQILFWTKSHEKNLIFAGAQILRTEEPIGAAIEP
jgi:hypothetical protein